MSENRGGGIWIPEHIVECQSRKELRTNETTLLAIIHDCEQHQNRALTTTFLANRLGVGIRRVQQMLSTLKDSGFVQQKINGEYKTPNNMRENNEGAKSAVKRNILRRTGGGESNTDREVTESTKSVKSAVKRNILRPTDLSPQPPLKGGPEREVGRPGMRFPPEDFNLVPAIEKTNSAFDLRSAIELLETCRCHLGTSHRICRYAKTAMWANHFRLLRTADEIPENVIKAVLVWYAENIGREFVPEVFSGESFRRKFRVLLRQSGCSVVVTELSQGALNIANRLSELSWPCGSKEHLPVVVQECLINYKQWVEQCRMFMERLRGNELTYDYGTERARLLRFGEYLGRMAPGSESFVRAWMENVHVRVCAWDGWNGKFAPFVFRPGAEWFQTMGRAWAHDYANDSNRWDRFCAVMEKEVSYENK